MKNLKTTIYVQVVYMILMGISFLLLPKVILPVFGFSEPTEIWIRVFGVLIICFSYYYWVLASAEIKIFFRASVLVRYFFCLSLVVLTLSGYAEKPLLLFALLETSLAIWTHVVIKKTLFN